MKCVFNSVDENNYSRISVTIPPLPGCKYTAVRCDSFVSNCNIRVLNSRDYLALTIGDKPLTIYFSDWSNLNVETFAELLNYQFSLAKIEEKINGKLECFIDNCNRYYFVCDQMFWFNDMTYNVKLLMGLYSIKDEEIRSEKLKAEPINNSKYQLNIKSVGMFMSTPILNLVSNIGDPALRNSSDDIINIQSCNTVLRINNSFSSNVPIISGGDGTQSIIPSGYVSGAVFVLVDANMHQVDLLNPMYITLTLEPLSSRYTE